MHIAATTMHIGRGTDTKTPKANTNVSALFRNQSLAEGGGSTEHSQQLSGTPSQRTQFMQKHDIIDAALVSVGTAIKENRPSDIINLLTKINQSTVTPSENFLDSAVKFFSQEIEKGVIDKPMVKAFIGIIQDSKLRAQKKGDLAQTILASNYIKMHNDLKENLALIKTAIQEKKPEKIISLLEEINQIPLCPNQDFLDTTVGFFSDGIKNRTIDTDMVTKLIDIIENCKLRDAKKIYLRQIIEKQIDKLSDDAIKIMQKIQLVEIIRLAEFNRIARIPNEGFFNRAVYFFPQKIGSGAINMDMAQKLINIINNCNFRNEKKISLIRIIEASKPPQLKDPGAITSSDDDGSGAGLSSSQSLRK